MTTESKHLRTHKTVQLKSAVQDLDPFLTLVSDVSDYLDKVVRTYSIIDVRAHRPKWVIKPLVIVHTRQAPRIPILNKVEKWLEKVIASITRLKQYEEYKT